MKVSEAFPNNSKWLSASELQGFEVKVQIAALAVAEFREENKPALLFVGKQKGLALNRTNARKLAAAFGDEMDSWVGKEIIIYPEVVDFGGRPVDSIRVRPVLAAAPAGETFR